MEIIPVKTRTLVPPKDDLLSAIKASDVDVQEGDCIAVTSKVVSIWQGRCVPTSEAPHKDEIAKKEAEFYIERDETPFGHVLHTITNNFLISSAGIDLSNADDHYVLWPKDPKQTAKELLVWFKETYKIKELFLIITDSHSVPFRRGVVGCAIGWAGFNPLYSHCGQEDLFGRELLVEHTNIPDALAAASVYVMGEANESMPLAVIRNAPYLAEAAKTTHADEQLPYEIPMEKDMYMPLFKDAPWKKGGANS